jgi:hypothetical protein
MNARVLKCREHRVRAFSSHLDVENLGLPERQVDNALVATLLKGHDIMVLFGLVRVRG